MQRLWTQMPAPKLDSASPKCVASFRYFPSIRTANPYRPTNPSVSCGASKASHVDTERRVPLVPDRKG
jgi:hypothetical protein